MRSRWKWLTCVVVMVLSVVAWATTASIDPRGFKGGGDEPSGDIQKNGPPSPGDPMAWAIPEVPGNKLFLILRNGTTVILTQGVDDEGNLCYLRAGSSGPPVVPSLTVYFWDNGYFDLWVGGTTNVTPGATYTQD